jgi:hypothetical protein
MLKKSTQIIVIALCTSVALIGFSLYQSRAASIPVSAVALYIAAAIVCVSPAAYHFLVCKGHRSRAAARLMRRPHSDSL